MKQKDKWEDDAKDHFIAALKDAGRGEWVVFDTDVVVDKATNRNFDYQLKSGDNLIALEVFRLVGSKEEIVRQKTWTIVTSLIVEELRKRGIKEYTIRVPWMFDVPSSKVPKLVLSVADQLEATILADPKADSIVVGEFEIKRIEGLEQVSLFGVGPGGAVDPTGTAYDFINRKLPDKNRQLDIADHERVVLIVNGAMIVDPSNLIEACTRADFSQFENIDKVYVENPQNKAVEIVFDRTIYKSFQPGGRPPERIDDPLFISWLANRLYQLDEQAFVLVRQITKREKTLLWLPAHTREQLIEFGEKALGSGDRDRLNWIVDHLKDDPDPTVENDPSDPEGKYNDHLRTKNGESNFLIHSVRSRLCWLLMKMVAQPLLEEYERIFEIVERYATGDNLFVRVHSAVPLIELAKRRYARLGDKTRFMSDELAEMIKQLALRMVAENESFPAVLIWAIHAILPVHDVDSDTALWILKSALPIGNSEASQDIAWMMIYFAFFRSSQFSELRTFDPEPIKQLIMEQLSKSSGIAAMLAQQLKVTLDRKEIDFPTVIPYLEASVNGKSVRTANYRLYGLVAAHGGPYPDTVLSLIEKCVDQEINSLETKGCSEVWHPKEFSSALRNIEQSDPKFKDRIERLRQKIQSYKDRHLIHDIWDF